jgi:hypothetical protein
MKKLTLALLSVGLASTAFAQKLTYSQHIRPLWEEMCERCHGASSPSYQDFLKFRDDPAVNLDGKGPRMDTYEGMMYFVNGPEAGALMRMLDDGAKSPGGSAGPMYRHLGRSAQRKPNLQIFKQWIGEEAWVVKKAASEFSKEELQKISAAN